MEEITLVQIYAKVNILDDMEKDITGLKSDVATLLGVRKDLTDLSGKVDAHILECDGTKDQVKRVDQETQILKTQNDGLKKRVDKLMYQIRQQKLAAQAEASFKTHNREKSLVIEGLVERDGEDPIRLAASIMSRTGRRVHPLDNDDAYCEGPKHNRRKPAGTKPCQGRGYTGNEPGRGYTRKNQDEVILGTSRDEPMRGARQTESVPGTSGEEPVSKASQIETHLDLTPGMSLLQAAISEMLSSMRDEDGEADLTVLG